MKKTFSYNVPTHPDEIPLWKLEKIMSDDTLTDEERPLESAIKLVTLMADIPLRELYAMNRESIDEICRTITTAALDIKRPFNPVWKVGEDEYRMDPDLEKLSTGAILDIASYFDDTLTNHKAMAALFRKVKRSTDRAGGLYTVEPYTGVSDELAEVFRQMPASYLWGVRSFFLSTGEELKRISESFLIQNTIKKSRLKSV